SLFLLANYPHSLERKDAQVIEGQVVAESNSKPVSRAYVYIIEGEEEALTDDKGHFRIKTWQKFPVQLTIKYRDRPVMKWKVSSASGTQVIRLKGV
ncbi:MAG TPA: carboxypeptidase-like regulatory domain-containing protein, partial [Chitinophagaceae bacterium]|nr:carboxypeptidase-like regulatory domain-containing protein [Chitinophagaceae bacterium]